MLYGQVPNSFFPKRALLSADDAVESSAASSVADRLKLGKKRQKTIASVAHNSTLEPPQVVSRTEVGAHIKVQSKPPTQAIVKQNELDERDTILKGDRIHHCTGSLTIASIASGSSYTSTSPPADSTSTCTEKLGMLTYFL